jgi:hypothetical protein
LPQRALRTSASDSSPAQRAQRMTSRHFIRFGARGPSGWSARGRGFCARGARGVFRSSSWYPRCRYLRSDMAQSRPSVARSAPAAARGLLFTVSKASPDSGQPGSAIAAQIGEVIGPGARGKAAARRIYEWCLRGDFSQRYRH